MTRPLGPLVVLRRVLDGIRWAHDLGRPVLPLRRPHGDSGQEAAVVDLELDQGIRDIASACMSIRRRLGIRSGL
jgi:hypothetical protein